MLRLPSLGLGLAHGLVLGLVVVNFIIDILVLKISHVFIRDHLVRDPGTVNFQRPQLRQPFHRHHDRVDELSDRLAPAHDCPAVSLREGRPGPEFVARIEHLPGSVHRFAVVETNVQRLERRARHLHRGLLTLEHGRRHIAREPLGCKDSQALQSRKYCQDLAEEPGEIGVKVEEIEVDASQGVLEGPHVFKNVSGVLLAHHSRDGQQVAASVLELLGVRPRWVSILVRVELDYEIVQSLLRVQLLGLVVWFDSGFFFLCLKSLPFQVLVSPLEDRALDTFSVVMHGLQHAGVDLDLNTHDPWAAR